MFVFRQSIFMRYIVQLLTCYVCFPAKYEICDPLYRNEECPQRTFPCNWLHRENHIKLDFWVFVFLDSPNIKVSPSSFIFLKKNKES